MSENEKLERSRRRTKIILITITVLFIVLMLVVPLLSVIVNSLREGFTFYIESISTEYVRHSLLVTLLATGIAVVVNTIFGICAAWLLTKFSFRGKQILAYPIFDIAGHRRTCLPDDLRQTWMVLPGAPGV